MFDTDGTPVQGDEFDSIGAGHPASLASRSKLMAEVEQVAARGYTVCLIDELFDNIL